MCLLEGNCTSACEEAMKDINNGSDKETSDDNEEKEEVKHGNLSVSVEGQGTTKDIPTKGTVVMDSLTFKASEETTLRSVTFETTGLTDTASIEEIRFEKDGVKVGYEKSFDAKWVAKVSLGAKGFTVKKNETLDLIVKVNSNNAGSKIAFKVTDVESSATAKVSNDETVVCTLVTYGVAKTIFKGNANESTVKLGEEDVVTLGSFTVQNKKSDDDADKRSITLKSIAITNNGKAELEDLSDIVIEKDGKSISSKVTIEKDKMIIVFNDEIESNVKPEYTIKASIDRISHNGDEYILVLDDESDLIVDETKSEFRSPVTIDDKTIGEVTVNGGTIQIDGSAKSKDAAKGGKVLVAEGTFETSTPVTFKNWISVAWDDAQYSFIINIAEWGEVISKDDAYVQVNKMSYELKKINDTTLWVRGNIDFTETTNTVKVYVTLSDDDDDYKYEEEGEEKTITTVKFDDIKAINFSNNGMFDSVKMNDELQKEIMGAIAMSNINIKDADLSLDKATSFKNETHKYVVKSSNRTFTIFSGELSNSQIDTVVVNTFTIKWTAKSVTEGDGDEATTTTYALAGDDYIELELKINGKSISADIDSRRIKGNEGVVTFKNFTQEIASEDTASVEVIARVYAYENDSADAEYSFEYSAKGYDKDISSRPDVFTTSKKVSTIVILGNGEATANTNINDIKSKNVFTRGDTVNFAKWNVSVKNDTLTLNKIVIAGTFDKDMVENAKVSYVNNDTKATGKLKKEGTVAATSVTFDGESVDLEPGNYTFNLSVSLNDDIDPEEQYSTTSVDMTFENGEFKDSPVTMSYVNTIFPMIPTVSVSKEIKGLSESMEISVYNPGNEDLVIGGFDTTDGQSEVAFNNVAVDSSNPVTISKWQTAKFVVRATSSSGYDEGNVIVVLNSISMKYDDSESYNITKAIYSNFEDIKVEYRINK